MPWRSIACAVEDGTSHKRVYARLRRTMAKSGVVATARVTPISPRSRGGQASYDCLRQKTGQPSAGHPFDERPVHRVRPLHGGKMSAIGDDDEPRAGDAGGDLLRQRRRSELIAVADEHQGRTLDR